MSTRSKTGYDTIILNFTSNREDWTKFPVIESGDGCYVTDATGKVYLDGLAGLFTTQVGHGRRELADVAAAQIRQLEFYPTWGLHHPRSLELSSRLAELAPGSLACSFFVSSGSEAVESMLKMVRQYHIAHGQPDRYKFIARDIAYHGTTFGALGLTGLPILKDPFQPMLPWFLHVPNTNQDPDGAADAIRAAIEAGPPQAVAAVVLEPVQNGGGCLVPPEDYWPQVREICDEYGVLLVADSTICAFGRVGSWFGTERFGAEPDIITFAKGLTSGYIPMGGVIVSDRVREALDSQSMYLHGATFGGHPVAAAVALTNIAIIEREGLIDNVLALENVFGDALRQMAESHPIVIDVRGIGFFWAIELQPAWPDGRPLSEEDYRRYFKDDLYHRLVDLGLLCRFDDRDSPVIQLAPALIADADVLARIVDIVAVAVSDLERALGYASSP